MNHLEELEMKWDASKIIFLMPIVILGMFAILTLVLFQSVTSSLPNDCTSYAQDWKVQICKDSKQTAIQVPLTMALICLGMIGFRELMKRTYYKELFA